MNDMMSVAMNSEKIDVLEQRIKTLEGSVSSGAAVFGRKNARQGNDGESGVVWRRVEEEMPDCNDDDLSDYVICKTSQGKVIVDRYDYYRGQWLNGYDDVECWKPTDVA